MCWSCVNVLIRVCLEIKAPQAKLENQVIKWVLDPLLQHNSMAARPSMSECAHENGCMRNTVKALWVCPDHLLFIWSLIVITIQFGLNKEPLFVIFQGIPGELGAVGQIGPRVGEHSWWWIIFVVISLVYILTVRLNNYTYYCRVSVEFLAREENWVQLVYRDLKESLGHLVLMDQRYWTVSWNV